MIPNDSHQTKGGGQASNAGHTALVHQCIHCKGTGRAAPATSGKHFRAAVPTAASAKKQLPFSADVEARRDAGRLQACGVHLFIRPEPRPVPDPWERKSPDAWSMCASTNAREGAGAAMVFPDGDDPADYEWPILPQIFEDRPVIVVWAFRFTKAEQMWIGEALIAQGYAIVDVLGGPGGPLRFRDEENQRKFNSTKRETT